MGMSWMLWSRGGSRIVSHSGGTIGQQSAFTLVPERGFAASVLTNSQSGVLLAAEVTDWVLERFLGLRSSAPTVIVGRARLAEYAGEYAMPDGSQTIRIEEDDGTLHIEVHGIGLPEVDLPLRVVGDDGASAEFPWEGARLPILTDFVRDDAGQVRWIRFLGRLVPRTN
jgi:hypothetical protein